MQIQERILEHILHWNDKTLCTTERPESSKYARAVELVKRNENQIIEYAAGKNKFTQIKLVYEPACRLICLSADGKLAIAPISVLLKWDSFERYFVIDLDREIVPISNQYIDMLGVVHSVYTSIIPYDLQLYTTGTSVYDYCKKLLASRGVNTTVEDIKLKLDCTEWDGDITMIWIAGSDTPVTVSLVRYYTMDIGSIKGNIINFNFTSYAKLSVRDHISELYWQDVSIKALSKP